ncbi:hypothetical protein WEI85_00110 [Actinomycetes bacterium KLBMP 9797]
MPTPTVGPDGRDPNTVASLAAYPPTTPVWVYRSGSWRPGIVLQASARAAMVRYRPTEQQGTAVDTVTAVHLAHREDPDRFLDQPSPRSYP